MDYSKLAVVFFVLAVIFLALAFFALFSKYVLKKIFAKKDKKQKRGVNQFLLFGCFIFIGLAVLYFPIQYYFVCVENQIVNFNLSGVFKAIGSSIYCAIRAFIIEGDFEQILTATNNFGSIAGEYYALSWLYLIVAAALTAGFILSFIRNLVSSVRYYLNHSQEIYYISEANERSISLAKSIIESGKRKVAPILFFNVSKKTDAGEELAEEVKELGCISFEKDICEMKLKPRKKNANRKFFFISENEDSNVKQALTLLKKLTSNPKLNTSNNEMYVFAISRSSEVLLDSAENGEVKVRRVSENRNLATKMVLDYPIFNRFVIDPESGVRKMHALIVGFGQYGMELLKTLSWSSMMPNYKLKVTVLDKLPNIRDIALKYFPELVTATKEVDGKTVKEYDIEFIGGIDVESAEFLNKACSFNDVTTVYVTLGDDERNLTTAIEMSSEFSRRSILYGGFRPVIYPVVYSNIKYQTFKDCDKLRSFDGEDYLLELVGDMDTRFSLDTIEHKDLEAEALECHLFWSGTVTSEYENRRAFERYEYHRKSSLSRAVSLRLLDMYGISEKTHSSVMLDYLEHERWNAYMRAEGYVFAKDVKNHVAKVHKLIVPFDKLDELERAKDGSVKGSKSEE